MDDLQALPLGVCISRKLELDVESGPDAGIPSGFFNITANALPEYQFLKQVEQQLVNQLHVELWVPPEICHLTLGGAERDVMTQSSDKHKAMRAMEPALLLKALTVKIPSKGRSLQQDGEEPRMEAEE